jgi:lysylphosphatidylglycerol synthetase-like protein (DUF2156 family)
VLITQQHFVGTVTMVLGLVSLWAAFLNLEWFFQLNKMRWLEAYCGRSASRWICGTIGCGLILLGVCIWSGLLPRRQAAHSPKPPRFALELAHPC